MDATKKFREWLPVIITFVGWFISFGMFWERNEAMAREIVVMRQELARKDVTDEKLNAVTIQLAAIQNQLNQLLRER